MLMGYCTLAGCMGVKAYFLREALRAASCVFFFVSICFIIKNCFELFTVASRSFSAVSNDVCNTPS
jgi:hypothetical protein